MVLAFNSLLNLSQESIKQRITNFELSIFGFFGPPYWIYGEVNGISLNALQQKFHVKIPPIVPDFIRSLRRSSLY